MSAWKYSRGEWSEIEDPLVWDEGEDFETALQRAGYYTIAGMSFGTPGEGGGVEVHFKKDYEPPFLISFDISDTVEHCYIDDIPNLMQWLRDYVPLYSQESTHSEVQELVAAFGKAFHAWHGHRYSSVCPSCAPEEYKRLQELNKEIEERRRSRKQEGAL